MIVFRRGTPTRAGYLDSAGAVLDITLLTLTVTDSDDVVVVGPLAMTQSAAVPNVYVSEAVTLLAVGSYLLQWDYDGDSVEIEPAVCSQVPSGDALVGSEIVLPLEQPAGDSWTFDILDQHGSSALGALPVVFDAGKGAYVSDPLTLVEEGLYTVVWLMDVGGFMIPQFMETLSLFMPAGTELCNFLVLTSSAPSEPHSATQLVVMREGVATLTLRTNISGEAHGYLQPGAYTVALLRDGHVFSYNNIAFEVVENETNTVNILVDTLTPTVSPAVPPPEAATLYIRMWRSDATPHVNAPVQVELLASSVLLAGVTVLDRVHTYYTDSNGYTEFTAIQGAKLAVRLPIAGFSRTITVPSGVDAQDPIDLAGLLSQAADDAFDMLVLTNTAAFRRDL
jgi:hypothetical protein